MDDVVERVMTSYANYERQGREEIRVKVGQYLEKLASAGHRESKTCFTKVPIPVIQTAEKSSLDKRCCPEPCGTPR
jgi:hypothetical protein